MSEGQEPDETISRQKVERLAENMKSAANELLDLIDSDEIRIEPLLEVSRTLARSARRISRRANWSVGEPSPGNERVPASRSPSRSDERGRGRPSAGASRRDGDRDRGHDSYRGGSRAVSRGSGRGRDSDSRDRRR